MNLWQAIVLGAVEGVTEFLPVSSTAHLIMTGRLLNLPATEFFKTFEISIQAGAILAVIWFYRKRLIHHTATWRKIASAFLPTALAGLIFYPLVKGYLLANAPLTAFILMIGGVVLIFFERWFNLTETSQKPDSAGGIENLNYRQAALIGLAQALAIVPGVSRAGATIVASRLAGLSRVAAVEFSFLLALPTVAAAAGYDLWQSGLVFSRPELEVWLIGLVASFLSASLVVRWLLRYVGAHDFKSFGWYRIAAGLLFLLLVW